MKVSDFSIRKYIYLKDRYKDAGTKYCFDVLTEKIIAGKLIKLACLRHLNDLIRSEKNTKDFPFFYSVDIAQGIINFAEVVPDVTTNKPLTLASFQKFIYVMEMAWRKRGTNGMRFKRSYISMSRTNSKTQIASTLADYNFLLGTPAYSREIVISSNTTSQIEQLYNYVSLTLEHLLNSRYFGAWKNEVIINSERAYMPKTKTRLFKLSADSKRGGDSSHPTLAIFDEYHLQTTTDFVDSLSSGNVQNSDATLIIISTAGNNPNVPMFKDYKAYTKMIVNDDDRKLDDVLFLCWEQDNDDEVWEPDTWIKSNPLLEVEAIHDKLMDGLLSERDSQASQGSLSKFLTKNMNRWQNSKDGAYLDLSIIQKSIIKHGDFNIDHRDVYIGFDASLASDDNAIAFAFPYMDGEQQKWHLYQHSFIPTKVAGGIQAKVEQDGLDYVSFEEQGWCDITKDRFGMINQDEVYEWVITFVEKHDLNVKAMLYDAWGTGRFIRRLDENRENWLLIPVRQGTHSLSEPTKFLRDMFTAENVTMFDDGLMQAAFTNAVLKSDNNGIQVDKNKATQKIDIVDAMIDAVYEGMNYFDDWSNAPEEKTKSPFGNMSSDEINDYFKKDFSF